MSNPAGKNTTAWVVLENPVFRRLWIAGVVMGMGQVIQDLTSSWLMTTLTSNPLPVALLQTALSLPVLFVAFPGGALADLLDRRKWMIALLGCLSLVGLLLAGLAYGGKLTPEGLLAMVFITGCLSAAFTPSWMRTVPDVLSGPQIPMGVTLNSTAVNLARLGGASIAAVVLSHWFIGAGFVLTSVGYLTLAFALYAWRPAPAAGSLPPENFGGAIMTGLRYALHSETVKRVAWRTLAFSVFGSSMLALLPTMARQYWNASAFSFGMMWAAFGLGAVLGATVLVPLRQRLSLDVLIVTMTGILAFLLLLLSQLSSIILAYPLMLMAGMAWVSMVSTFGVSMGAASPPWVLSRMLSLYVLSFQGAAAVGSIFWGQLAHQLGVPLALSIAALGLASTMVLARFAPMPAANPQQLEPSRHWPDLHAAANVPHDAPVTVTIEYLVNAEDEQDFRTAIAGLRAQRLRDGAVAWTLHHSVEAPQHFLEQFQLHSWLDHLRQHDRVTHADRSQQVLVHRYHVGPNPPVVRHWLTL